jgi:hypothetical protein
MDNPADSLELAVLGDPSRARDTVAAALAARGFSLVWSDPWTATATKGKRAVQFLLGAFAPHFVVEVSVFSRTTAAGAETIVRLARPSAGITGGLLAVVRVRRQFSSLGAEVREIFRNSGVLREPPSVSEPQIAPPQLG